MESRKLWTGQSDCLAVDFSGPRLERLGFGPILILCQEGRYMKEVIHTFVSIREACRNSREGPYVWWGESVALGWEE